MKTLKAVVPGIVALLMVSSCGVKERHDDIKTLNKKSEWNEEQTNQAIDYYIEGVNEACGRMEDMWLVQEKQDLKYSLNRYGDEDALKDRRKEIKAAEKELQRVRKEVEKKLSASSSSSDYDDNYDDFDDDYEY